mmetsp:Transcript_92702/g.271380  ORF Transcript_92702/g.271380 Transcript_92702/m.271380 type:complete len:243 (+) Transcript_92702:340-1068(+)
MFRFSSFLVVTARSMPGRVASAASTPRSCGSGSPGIGWRSRTGSRPTRPSGSSSRRSWRTAGAGRRGSRRGRPTPASPFPAESRRACSGRGQGRRSIAARRYGRTTAGATTASTKACWAWTRCWPPNSAMGCQGLAEAASRISSSKRLLNRVLTCSGPMLSSSTGWRMRSETLQLRANRGMPRHTPDSSLAGLSSKRQQREVWLAVCHGAAWPCALSTGPTGMHAKVSPCPRKEQLCCSYCV